ncbi:MMPL family transporter [Antrihabitans sp. YC3-6]|uniref:MMPL family transporter n=1 Tax=Antrihabitans stalagmiti TaxID=2799499 RepID=A0A934U4N4_9NOCA|nr:MMPL family transporter [Antrihabitans stalagmiti]MBJ8339978.1 MMPL family transporter [Antrihabitans stalagmiti]
MLTRFGHFVTSHARAILAVTLFALIGAAVLGSTAFGNLQSEGFDDPASESSRAAVQLADNFPGGADLILVADAHRNVDDTRAAGTQLTDRLAADPAVAGVISYWQTNAPTMRSDDATMAIVAVTLKAPADESAKSIIDNFSGSVDGFDISIGGKEGVMHDVGEQIGTDLIRAEMIAIPLMLVLLGLAFGSIVAALLPLAIGVFAIFGTFAELAILGSTTDVSIYAINLTTSLGLGLAIDYALLMVSRFREEYAKSGNVDAAVVRTIETAGRTILFSSTAVAAALAVLTVFPMYFLRSFAYAGIGVIVIAMLGGLIVLPAMLTVLGPRVNAGKLPWAKHLPSTVVPFWGTLARLVMRRPLVTALPVVALMVLLAAPLLHVEFGTPDDRVLPTSASSREAGDALRDKFTADDTSAIDVVSTGAVVDLQGLAGRLSQLDDVERVDTSAGTFVDGGLVATSPMDSRFAAGDAQRLSIVTDIDPRSDAAKELVTAVRSDTAGADVLVGGETAEIIDSQDAIASRLPLAIGLIVLSTFVLLFLFTGSVLQPLRALVLNVIGLSATIGVLVLIFQEGWLSGLLGFTPLPLDTSMLVLMFCITFGLSMDYEVFVMSRIKEMHDNGASDEDAVADGLSRTGRIVSMAAVILAVSFFSFGTSSVSFIQMFGIGAGLAVLIDATLIRGVLVPAAMRVLGRSAWWAPAPLRKIHDRVGVSEERESVNA